MRAVRFDLLAAGLMAAALVSGCGLSVDIMGGGPTRTGATQTFEIKLTNQSACPLASDSVIDDDADFAFVPFLPDAFVEENEELQLLCGLLPMQPSVELAQAGAVDPVALQNGLQTVLAQSAAAVVSCSGAGATCEPFDMFETPAGVVGCDLPPFAPGAMLTLTCQATVPGGLAGDVYTLALAGLSADGVCKAGTNQGQPCFDDDDCGGGDDSCGEGICDGGTNDGLGCDEQLAETDCGAGGMCIDCDEGTGIGADCAVSSVAPVARAPLMGPLGLAGAALGLAALARRRLRARS